MDSFPPFVTVAPRDAAGWTRLFDWATLPVLPATAAAVDALIAVEDEVDAHGLSETVGSDPLLTLKLLAHVAHLRQGRDGGDAETVTEALVMLGIPPFFRAFAAQATVGQWLAQRPDALQGLERVLRRSHRAARFALGFAVHRLDPDATTVHEAALLHGFAELLLWLRAPDLALEIGRRQARDAQLRSDVAQRAVLHVTLNELQHALMEIWHLPRLLVQLTDATHDPRTNRQQHTVALAVRIARHSAAGWDNPALPDDVAALGTLLQLTPEPTLRLLRDIDAESV